MPEVTKFKVIGYMVERSRVGGAEYVMLSDFDLVTVERDALQQRLTAADERADVLEGRKGDLELSLMWVRSQLTDALIIRFIDAALKPAEPASCSACGGKGSMCVDWESGAWSECAACAKPAEGGGDE